MNGDKFMVVGVPARSLIGWGGGLDLIVSYVKTLAKMEGVDVVVFIEKRPLWYKIMRKIFYYLRDNKKASELAISEIEAKHLFSNIVGKSNVVLFNNFRQSAKKLDEHMKKRGVDVCFLETGLVALDVSVPKVPYLYDFQYKYLPNLFSQKDIYNLNNYFSILLDRAEAVIVEAYDVKKDVDLFFPKHKAKVFVMPYTAIPEKEWLIDDDKVVSKYKLPSKFFVISNQFWMHKDHSTAFNALGLLKKRGYSDVYLVCTGKMEDDRNPDYINELKKCCENYGIKERVIFLGYIPKSDQIQILKKSIAVVQPTTFEGNPGGGIGYNAVSLKHSIILSDIPINRELVDSCVCYFKTGNPVDLCEKMEEQLAKPIEKYTEKQLIEWGAQREEELQNCIINALEYAVKASNS